MHQNYGVGKVFRAVYCSKSVTDALGGTDLSRVWDTFDQPPGALSFDILFGRLFDFV